MKNPRSYCNGFCLLLLTFCFALTRTSVALNEYYIAPTGSDSTMARRRILGGPSTTLMLRLRGSAGSLHSRKRFGTQPRELALASTSLQELILPMSLLLRQARPGRAFAIFRTHNTGPN